MGAFTGDIDLKGQGTDFLSPKTNLQAKARIKKFQYGQYNLDGMNATAMVKNGRMKADIDSNNPLLKGQFTGDALTNKKLILNLSTSFIIVLKAKRLKEHLIAKSSLHKLRVQIRNKSISEINDISEGIYIFKSIQLLMPHSQRTVVSKQRCKYTKGSPSKK